jgi:hypothetical protein
VSGRRLRITIFAQAFPDMPLGGESLGKESRLLGSVGKIFADFFARLCYWQSMPILLY